MSRGGEEGAADGSEMGGLPGPVGAPKPGGAPGAPGKPPCAGTLWIGGRRKGSGRGVSGTAVSVCVAACREVDSLLLGEAHRRRVGEGGHASWLRPGTEAAHGACLGAAWEHLLPAWSGHGCSSREVGVGCGPPGHGGRCPSSASPVLLHRDHGALGAVGKQQRRQASGRTVPQAGGKDGLTRRPWGRAARRSLVRLLPAAVAGACEPWRSPRAACSRGSPA